MSMKKTDLAKNMALKLNGQMKNSTIPDRFAQGATAAQAKREQRRVDAAAGLVPFACKLPADLLRQLTEQAAATEGGMNALVLGLLKKGLG